MPQHPRAFVFLGDVEFAQLAEVGRAARLGADFDGRRSAAAAAVAMMTVEDAWLVAAFFVARQGDAAGGRHQRQVRRRDDARGDGRAARAVGLRVAVRDGALQGKGSTLLAAKFVEGHRGDS